MVLQLNKQPVTLEIDTGTAVSILPERLRKQAFPQYLNICPKRTEVRLCTYTSKPTPVLGQICVPVRYQEYEGTHTFYVVEDEGPAVLGRDLLSHIKLDWCSIKSVVTGEPQHTLEKLLEKYGEVFQTGFGAMTRIKAHLTLKTGTRPIFCRFHSVLFAIRDKLGHELDRLEGQGLLQRVNYSEWAAPRVPVPKKDGSIRVCGDYKVTINPYLQVDQYPLPKPSELFACLTGGQSFTKLDLTAAYQQMMLDEESAKLVTVNMHQGLYQFYRLLFGVESAPAIFQRAMDSILQGLPFVICYLNDILVSGRMDKDHLKNLKRCCTD